MEVTCAHCGASIPVEVRAGGNLTYDGLRLMESCGRQKARGPRRDINVKDFDCPDFRAALLKALQQGSG